MDYTWEKISEYKKNWDFHINQIIKTENPGCNGISEYYTKDVLTSTTEDNPIIVLGFCEYKWIWFNYRYTDGEECELYISEKIVPWVKNDWKNKIRTFKWKTGKYANRFKGYIEITKHGEDGYIRYYFQIDVLTQLQAGANNLQNFHNMMNEIKEFVYRMFNPSKITTSEEEYISPIVIEQFFYLIDNNIIKEAEHTIKKISSDPYYEYIQENRREVVTTVNNNVILGMLSNTGNMVDIRSSYISNDIKNIFIENGVNYVSENIFLPRPRITYDVPPNQLIIKLSKKIILCTIIVEQIFEDEKKILQKQKKDLQKRNKDQSERDKLMTKDRQIGHLDDYIRKCREYRIRIKNMLKYQFLQGVHEVISISRSTPILQKNRDYNKIYKIYQRFIKMPKFLFSNSLGLEITDTPTAFEYWSVVRYVIIIKDKLKDWTFEDNMKKECEYGYVVSFPSGKLLEFIKENVRICLYYHESYDKFTGGYFITDIALDGIINNRLIETIIFDAKYTSRLDSGTDNPRGAINMLHATRDATIGHHEKDRSIIESGDQIVKQAYDLFLGKGDIRPLPNDPDSKAGGIKFYPMNTDIGEIDKIVKNFIDRLLIKAIEKDCKKFNLIIE